MTARRFWFPFLYFIVSCCRTDSDDSRGCTPVPACDDSSCPRGQHCVGFIGQTCQDSCKLDTECQGGKHCSVEFFSSAGQCIDGCVSDLECSSGTVCSVAPLNRIGSCAPGCSSDLQCPQGKVCSIPLLDSSGTCIDNTGGSGHPGASGSSGGGGSSGKGGMSGAGGVTGTGGMSGAAGAGGGLVIGGCTLTPEGSCQATIPGQICCAMVGHFYDEPHACVVEGGAPPGRIWCLPEQANDTGTCVFTALPACYERALADGTSETALVSFGLPAELLPAEISVCAQPPAASTPDCEPGAP